MLDHYWYDIFFYYFISLLIAPCAVVFMHRFCILCCCFINWNSGRNGFSTISVV